jgi:hypothetical protein
MSNAPSTLVNGIVRKKSTNRNRQGFSHREADEKSLLDEAFRREMGERGRANGDR